MADAQRLTANALGLALGRSRDIKVLEPQAVTGLEALNLVLHNRPDVALIDYWMPDMEGVALTRQLTQRIPGQKILLFSWFYGPEGVREALDAGAVGFLPRTMTVAELADAIRACHSGDFHRFDINAARIVDRLGRDTQTMDGEAERLALLTPREIEVLHAMSHGLPIKRLANRLSITAGTLQNHIHNILTKLDAQTQVEALDIAYRHHLIIR